MTDELCKGLLENHATPLYAFDIAELLGRMNFLREHLPKKVGLCYAVKANTFIIKELETFADRFEICSPGELRICRRLNIPTDKYVVSGVYKDPELMRSIISDGAQDSIYTVESKLQFSLLRDAASAAGKRISVLLRLSSGSQFGIDEHEVEEIISTYQYDEHIKIRGLQYFSGTQKMSLKRLNRELQKLDSFIEALHDMHGYTTEELEFGPGFPVTYFLGESFDEEDFLREFSSMLEQMKFKGKIMLELGRSIAACCGSYLTRVVDIKCNHSQNYAIVDGGMNHIVYYGQSMAMKHPHVSLFPKRESGQSAEWNICGSLCTNNDILVKQLSLEDLRIGDVLEFKHTGAYCMTEGISLFLSRDLPKVVIIKPDGSLITVRDGQPTDIINTPNYNI